jgi:hypothetical protein
MEAEHQGKSWPEIKALEQGQDPMVSFHKVCMPLRGVKGHTTTTTTTTTTTQTCPDDEVSKYV